MSRPKNSSRRSDTRIDGGDIRAFANPLRSVGALAILVTMALALSLCCHRAARPRPNVLWITMDSLRYDHLGCSGDDRAHTPHIDALAAEGTLFNQCIAQAPYTHLSVPSMITGKYPYFLGIRRLGQDLDSAHVTLAQALAAGGYFTCGILEPWPEGFYRGFEKLEHDNSGTLQKTQWCLETLDKLDGRPFFIWLYYWDPHAPYTPPVEHMRRYEPDYQLVDGFRPYGQDLRDATGLYGGSIPLLSRINQGRIVPTSPERDHLRHLYSAEISFVDAQIGQVLEKVVDLDAWKNTMVILNADHGETFGEHGKYYHGHDLYESQIHVPLIVKPPASVPTGRVVAGPVRNLDIMATILDYCGIAAPRGCNGHSLRPAVEGGQNPQWPACLETNSVQPPRHLMGYRDGRHKLIYDLTGGGSELFDLAADPDEQRDLLSLGQGQAVAIQLGEEFLTTLGAEALADLALKEEREQLDPATRERLRALGYID